jgi:hypothetical protein
VKPAAKITTAATGLQQQTKPKIDTEQKPKHKTKQKRLACKLM